MMKDHYISKVLSKLFREEKLMNKRYEIMCIPMIDNTFTVYCMGFINGGVKRPVFGKKRLQWLTSLLNDKLKISYDKKMICLTAEQANNLYTLLKLKGVDE